MEHLMEEGEEVFCVCAASEDFVSWLPSSLSSLWEVLYSYQVGTALMASPETRPLSFLPSLVAGVNPMRSHS